MTMARYKVPETEVAVQVGRAPDAHSMAAIGRSAAAPHTRDRIVTPSGGWRSSTRRPRSEYDAYATPATTSIRSPAQWGTSFSVTPGIPLTTRTAVPAIVSAAPIAPCRDNRSPRYHGLSKMSAIGSTVIRSAPFVAVECARPQFEQMYAPAKPTMPIHAIARRSAFESGAAG